MLTSFWCSVSRTVQANALADHGGFPLRAVINWSRRSLRAPVVHYIVSWQLSTSVSSYSQSIACCFLFSLLLVLCTIVKCLFWVIFLVAALATLRWTNMCLCCCCALAGGKLDEVAVIRLDWDLLPPAEVYVEPWLAVVVKVRKMITKRSGKLWGIYS